jgi:Xaa-Pro aminopeptidase
MDPRLKKIYALLRQEKLDAFFVTCAENISYLSESISRDSFLLASPKGNIYLTDSRYSREAEDTLRGDFTIETFTNSPYRFLAAVCKRQGIRKLGFEESHLSCAAFRLLRLALPRGLKLIPLKNLVEGLRQFKSEKELRLMQKAARITVAAFNFAEKMLEPGMSELEVVGELERFIRGRGALGSAFKIIVASGPNSSYPHHISCRRRLRKGEPVIIDMGVDYAGYKSDLTRTYFLDKITPLYRRIYAIVRRANQLAISRLKPGIRGSEIDRLARNYIAGEGYGKNFGHSLGHGVGLAVHEAPRLSAQEEVILKAGMVFTIEPGIYLPHKFGIRIEDMVYLTEKGAVVISGALHK